MDSSNHEVLLVKEVKVVIWLGIVRDLFHIGNAKIKKELESYDGKGIERGGLKLQFFNDVTDEQVGFGVSIFDHSIEHDPETIDLVELVHKVQEVKPKLRVVFSKEYNVFEMPFVYIQIEKK